MQILRPQQGTSWPSLISEIDKVGEKYGKPFPVEKESSIRPAISGRVKFYHPKRVYKAEKTVKEGVPVLWVWLKEIKE